MRYAAKTISIRMLYKTFGHAVFPDIADLIGNISRYSNAYTKALYFSQRLD